ITAGIAAKGRDLYRALRVQLAGAAGCGTCRELGRREAARGCELAHAAREIAQMQTQLIECKPEREDALQRLIRQLSRRAFAAQPRELGGVTLERRLGRLQRGRRLPG